MKRYFNAKNCEQHSTKKGTEYKIEGDKEIAEFNKRFDITPVLAINVVLKF